MDVVILESGKILGRSLSRVEQHDLFVTIESMIEHGDFYLTIGIVWSSGACFFKNNGNGTSKTGEIS